MVSGTNRKLDVRLQKGARAIAPLFLFCIVHFERAEYNISLFVPLCGRLVLRRSLIWLYERVRARPHSIRWLVMIWDTQEQVLCYHSSGEMSAGKWEQFNHLLTSMPKVLPH